MLGTPASDRDGIAGECADFCIMSFSAAITPFGGQKRKPGSMLRYDGQLYSPSACPTLYLRGLGIMIACPGPNSRGQQRECQGCGSFSKRPVRRRTDGCKFNQPSFPWSDDPPGVPQDDVVHTSIQPNDLPFEYRVRIPSDQPHGLYWYHPHLHGFTRTQVVGRASGALIVEGIERANREVAGLPERVIVIRDEDLLNPQAAPSIAGQKARHVLHLLFAPGR